MVLVGGTLVENIGGHNPLEPARVGCAVAAVATAPSSSAVDPLGSLTCSFPPPFPSSVSLLASPPSPHSLTSSPPLLGHACHSQVVAMPFTRGEHRLSQVACGPHAHNIAHLLAEMQAHDPRAILRVRLHSLLSPFPAPHPRV